jgi:hypothetical protein
MTEVGYMVAIAVLNAAFLAAPTASGLTNEAYIESAALPVATRNNFTTGKHFWRRPGFSHTLPSVNSTVSGVTVLIVSWVFFLLSETGLERERERERERGVSSEAEGAGERSLYKLINHKRGPSGDCGHTGYQ